MEIVKGGLWICFWDVTGSLLLLLLLLEGQEEWYVVTHYVPRKNNYTLKSKVYKK